MCRHWSFLSHTFCITIFIPAAEAIYYAEYKKNYIGCGKVKYSVELMQTLIF